MVFGYTAFAFGVFSYPDNKLPVTAVWYERCPGVSDITTGDYPVNVNKTTMWYDRRLSTSTISRCKDEGK